MTEVRVEIEADARAAPAAEIAVVRVLGRLPAVWSYGHDVAPHRIRLRISAPGVAPGMVRAAVTAALADPALEPWRLRAH
ncbi:hypothetical protein PJ985_00510 [Streptomyces sp. ACA25]|uniref:hypothetical protein n=1 Tax=Streptomyces sp. ACA25 TaxID=3022596 RepID=UPI0023075ABD|nr:hypothetical protein [Streptomyces sp. ACA25]MDB1086064.1 hypothetical protein [Streptomyces sp. ACA25]